MSRTRQLGTSGSLACSSSVAEANAFASRPTDRNKLPRASHSEASSSMTRMVGLTGTALWADGCRWVTGDSSHVKAAQTKWRPHSCVSRARTRPKRAVTFEPQIGRPIRLPLVLDGSFGHALPELDDRS